jgi:LysM domain
VCTLVPVLGSACLTTSSSTTGFNPRSHREVDLEVAGEVRHRVEKGQTLYRIARTYGLSVDELMQANRIDDPRELKAGEELVVPGAHAPRAKVVETDSPEPTPPARPVASSPPLRAVRALRPKRKRAPRRHRSRGARRSSREDRCAGNDALCR